MDAKLEQMLKRVQDLLAKADDPACFPEESALYRDKADELMIKYRIDAATLGTTDTGEPLRPEWASVNIGRSMEWSNYLWSFASAVARHTGVRIRVGWAADGSGYEALVCGFVHDVAFFELLYTNIMMAFSSRLEPRYREDESPAANALRLRQGGMERARIARVLFADNPPTTLNGQKGQNRKVTKLIKDEANRLGHPEAAEEVLGRGFNARTYRKSYAAGFYDELVSRLRHATMTSDGAGMILKSAKERVDEAWYERFPQDRPSTAPVKWEDPSKDCLKCKASKRGACRDHYVPSGSYRTPTYNYGAVSKGRSAARSVDLGATGSTRTKAVQ